MDKLLHTALHKPRPGQQARDQRLVAREEQAQRDKDFKQRQVASPVRAIQANEQVTNLRKKNISSMKARNSLHPRA